MGKLMYSMNVSLDGFIEDAEGRLDWGDPDEELHRYFNEMESNSELALYGRRLYETMSVWEHFGEREVLPGYVMDYARIWKAERKIVFSSTLDSVGTSNTTLRRAFVASEIRALKEDTSGDIGIGGAGIASSALSMGLLDEIRLFIVPALVGGGKKWISGDRLRGLRLVETRRFGGGVLMVRYEVANRS